MSGADLVIDVGPLKVIWPTASKLRQRVSEHPLAQSDFNTGSFSYSIKSAQTVELHISHATVGYARTLILPLSYSCAPILLYS